MDVTQFCFNKGIIPFHHKMAYQNCELNVLFLIIYIMVVHREFNQLRFQATPSPGGYVVYYTWTVL